MNPSCVFLMEGFFETNRDKLSQIISIIKLYRNEKLNF